MIDGTFSEAEIYSLVLNEWQRVFGMAILAALPSDAIGDAFDALDEVYYMYFQRPAPRPVELERQSRSFQKMMEGSGARSVEEDRFVDPALKSYYAKKGLAV